jgi:hypothetical protein
MNLAKRILTGLAAGMLIVPLLAGCGQAGSNGAGGNSSGQQSASNGTRLLSMKEIAGTTWEYKGKTIEFTNETYQAIKDSQYTLPDRAYKDGGKSVYDPNLPNGLSAKDQTPLHKLNNTSITKGSNYYKTMDGVTQYPYYYSLTTYSPSQISDTEMCDGNAGNAAWSPSPNGLYLGITSQLYSGTATGCFIISATSKTMTIQTLQYTDGTQQNNRSLNFFGQGAQDEAKVNNNKITLSRVQ